MKKSITVEFHSIRDINSFYFINRRYSKILHFSSDICFSGEGKKYISDVKRPVVVTVEGSEHSLSVLFDSYRLCGIA